MSVTSLDNNSVYRFTARRLTLSSIRLLSGDRFSWELDSIGLVWSTERPGELDLDGCVLGVKDDAGLDTLGVAGRVITFLKSSCDTPRISATLATISES